MKACLQKNCVFLFLTVLILGFAIFAYSKTRQAVRQLASPFPTAVITPFNNIENLPTKDEPKKIKIDEKEYQFYFHKIEKNEKLILIPNFEEATFSAQIFKNNSCDFGINGGFYKKEGGPLGLFQTGEKKLGNQIQSATFNGFFSFCDSCKNRNTNSGFSISSSTTIVDHTSTSYDFIFQSGPLIYVKNQNQPNYIDEDYSRRSLAVKTADGEFYFFIIFERNNILKGPRLQDLKDIFLSEDFRKIADFEILLNLDGGSASAFYDKDIQVEEFKPIGSFLCGKKI